MARSFESYVSVFEDVNWRGSVTGKAFPLYLDSESLDTGKQIINNNNLTRDSRVNRFDSQVSGPIKPQGGISFQPRVDDIGAVLYSHFQVLNESTGDAPYTYEYNPAWGRVTYGDSGQSSVGTYRSELKDAFSVSFLKKYLNTDEYGGTNSIMFKHGICDSLTFNIPGGDDFHLECNYKFRDLVEGTAIADNPNSDSVGSYSELSPFSWYHGTVSVDGVDFGLESLRITSKNNLEERSRLGRQAPDSFIFREYEVEGEMTLDFPEDGMEQVGSMFNLGSFTMSGTLFQGTANKITFNLPNCIRQPFNVKLADRLKYSIPFKGFQLGSQSPFTVCVTSDTAFAFTGESIDAGTIARVIGDYEKFDSGTTTRTLSEYTIYDRSLL